jgi:hypothetical protein
VAHLWMQRRNKEGDSKLSVEACKNTLPSHWTLLWGPLRSQARISHHPRVIWVFVFWASKKALSRVNKVIINWQRPRWGGDHEVVKRCGRHKPICIVMHMHMEATLGFSLYSYPYLN